MKSCIRCKKKKELSEFYAHPQMADGHLNKCKVCVRNYSGTRRNKKLNDSDWVKSERERCRLKQEAYRKAGLVSQTKNKFKHAWRKRNRSKSRAHGVARKAHPNKPGRCQECKRKTDIIHRHHPDYQKPKEIIWLYPPCHGAKHRK